MNSEEILQKIKELKEAIYDENWSMAEIYVDDLEKMASAEASYGPEKWNDLYRWSEEVTLAAAQYLRTGSMPDKSKFCMLLDEWNEKFFDPSGEKK